MHFILFVFHIMCMCVHGFIYLLINLPFFHISLCLCSFSLSCFLDQGNMVVSTHVQQSLASKLACDQKQPPTGPLGAKGSTRASSVQLPPTILLRLTKPLERFKFESFNVTTLKPVEQETKEHHTNELINGILKPRQLLLCGVQDTH
jgi:hypothetical protein